MVQSYTQSVNTEQRVARRESERQEGEEMVEERVVNEWKWRWSSV